jgi:hypothetical protein
MSLTPIERSFLQAAGYDAAVIGEQVEALRRGVRPAHLLRACTLGDGIHRLSEEDGERLERRAYEARWQGRVSAFVPASGAASRMLSDVGKVADRARELALWSGLGEPEDVPGAIRARYAHVPKGLVPFHAYPEGPRTAFEEHLVEAQALCGDDQGHVRAHFTVSDDHRGAFAAELARVRGRIESAGGRLEVSFSTQDPATDTVALDAEGKLLTEGDRLLLRPGGHGALLRNLEACGGDLVLVKNIDNIVPDGKREVVLRWRSRLLGLLVMLQDTVHELLMRQAWNDPSYKADGTAFLGKWFGVVAEGDDVLHLLHRPIRVAGMVKNDGQPGGGPFFVKDRRGPQIVESVEVAHADAAQEAIWRASTHFNPVDLAVGLRDFQNRPHKLAEYSRRDAWMISSKTHDGKPITILEHPGLWNGGMADWNTAFVEMPRECFQPVKTLGDLLGEGHR